MSSWYAWSGGDDTKEAEEVCGRLDTRGTLGRGVNCPTSAACDSLWVCSSDRSPSMGYVPGTVDTTGVEKAVISRGRIELIPSKLESECLEDSSESSSWTDGKPELARASSGGLGVLLEPGDRFGGDRLGGVAVGECKAL